MRLMATIRKTTYTLLLCLALVFSSISLADTIEEKPSAGAMIIDTVLARPLYFVLSQAGALVYGATLPFTLLGGNADEAAEVLVVTPLQAAFVRCLGCGQIDNEVGALKEGEGKRIRHFLTLTGGQTSYNDKSSKQSGSTISGGFYLGTHFSLSDSSKFDVMLGYRDLGTIKLGKDAATPSENSLSSFQIASRFGRRAFWGMDFIGQLGVHSWNAEQKTSAAKEKASGINFFFGFGFSGFVSDDIRLGLIHSRYSLTDGDYKGSVNTTDLNLSYMF